MFGTELLRYKSKQKYCCADLETEGLNKIHSRPWQCSFITFDLHNLYESHDYYIWWPDLNVSAGAARQTRFDYHNYKNKAKDPLEVLAILEKYLLDPEYIKVGHNFLGYDVMIYNVWRRALGLKEDYSFLDKVIDTNCIAKAIKKKIDPDRKNRLQWQFKLCHLVERTLKTSLGKLGKDYKIDYDYETLHDGMNDVILNRIVFQKQIWEIEI